MNVLTRRLASLALPICFALYASPADARTVEQSIDWQGQTVQLQLNYPESVEIDVGDGSSVELRAEVVLNNEAADISEDFRWTVDSTPQQLSITADFGPRIGNTVLVQGGVDLSGGIGENTTVTGTRLHIVVPRNAKLSVESASGALRIRHPGNTLLIENNGTVEILVDQGFDLTFSSMLGSLHAVESLTLEGAGFTATNLKQHHPRNGLLRVNGGGAETSVTTLVGDIHLQPATPKVPPLSQQQLLQDFDQAVSYIEKFAAHTELNAQRLGIDYKREFQALRALIGPDTDLCEFHRLLVRALNLVQDLHANTMDYDYLSQYGQYQSKYNIADDASYAKVQAFEQACPQTPPALTLPLVYKDGKYLLYADIRVGGDILARGTELSYYNGQPINQFVEQNPTKVWPIMINAQGQRYSTRFYRQGDQHFQLGLADGRVINLALDQQAEWITPERHSIRYGSQSTHQVLYFDAERILYVGIPMMDASLVDDITQRIDAIVNAGQPIDKVVVDVRGNPGGSDVTWHGVMAHLMKKAFELNFDMRFKDNPATRAHFAGDVPPKSGAVALLANARYWRHSTEALNRDANPEAIDFQGKIYLLVDPYIYSSAGNLASYALLDEQVVSVGESTDLVGGAQIEPLFFQLDHSGQVFRLEPVLDFRGVETLDDFAHNQVEIPLSLSVDDLFLRSTYGGDIYGISFLRQHDPVFRHVARL